MRISVIWAPLFMLSAVSAAWAQAPAGAAAPPSPPSAASAEAPPPPAVPASTTSPASPSSAPAPAAPAVAAPSVPPTPQPEAAGGPSVANVSDWYVPHHHWDPHLPGPVEVERQRRKDTARHAVYLMSDVHGFVLGRISGVGSEWRVGIGGRYVGFTLGTYFPTADVSVGLDFFRHSGWRMSGTATHGVWLLAPTLEPRVFFSPRFNAHAGERTIVAVGSSLIGVRLTAGRWLFDLRLPRVDGWVMPFTERTSGAMSVGGSLLAGYDF